MTVQHSCKILTLNLFFILMMIIIIILMMVVVVMMIMVTTVDETDNNADDHTDYGGGNDDDDNIADESCESSDSENIPLVKLKRKTTKKTNISVDGTSEIDQSGDDQSVQSVDNLAYQSADDPISHSGGGHFQPAPSNSDGVQSQSTELQSTFDPSHATFTRGRKRKCDPANWQRNIDKQR